RTLAVAAVRLPRPPPFLRPELPVKVLPRTVAVAPLSFSMPPPRLAELPEKTLSLTVSTPKLSIPPPLPVPALPPAIVSPERDTVSPASTWKTRERLPPLTVSLAAPGPSIFRSSVMSISPLVRAMVPVSPSLKTMVSAPGWALAWATAARSEPSPLSAKVVTSKTDGTMRPSSDSRPSRARAGFGTAAAGRPRRRSHFETGLRTGIITLPVEGTDGARGNNARGPRLRRPPRNTVGLNHLLGQGLRTSGEVGVAAVDRP